MFNMNGYMVMEKKAQKENMLIDMINQFKFVDLLSLLLKNLDKFQNLYNKYYNMLLNMKDLLIHKYNIYLIFIGAIICTYNS